MMHNDIRKILLHSSIFLSLILFDYTLGRLLVDGVSKIFCRIVCCIGRYFPENNLLTHIATVGQTINVYKILSESIVFAVAIFILTWLQSDREKDKTDELLQESKNIVKQTSKLLEKWKYTPGLSTLNCSPTCESMDFEKARYLTPLRLELPLLQMAVFDPCAQEKHPESGDTGDICERTESTFLTFSPLLDENMEELFPENILLSHTENM